MLSRFTTHIGVIIIVLFLSGINFFEADAAETELSFTDLDAAKEKSWFIFNDTIENDPFAQTLQKSLFYHGLTTAPKYGGGRVRADFNYPVTGIYAWGSDQNPWFQYLIMENPSEGEIISFIRENQFEHVFLASEVISELHLHEENAWDPVYVNDENGRARMIHEFLGEYPWHLDKIANAIPNNLMRLWFMQISRFRYDFHKFKTNLEMWQSVAYTLESQKGICKDSATVLTDLLENRDYDARLAIGYHLETGTRYPTPHAWVSVRDKNSGKEYLLESTLETADFKMRTPPRTTHELDYIPYMQIKQKGYLLRSERDWTSDYTYGWQILNLDESDPMFDGVEFPGC